MAAFWSEVAALLAALSDAAAALPGFCCAALFCSAPLLLVAAFGWVSVLAAEFGVVELLAAAWFWSVALVFGFTGCEYEGAADEALLEGCVVEVVVLCEVVVLDCALFAA